VGARTWCWTAPHACSRRDAHRAASKPPAVKVGQLLCGMLQLFTLCMPCLAGVGCSAEGWGRADGRAQSAHCNPAAGTLCCWLVPCCWLLTSGQLQRPMLSTSDSSVSCLRSLRADTQLVRALSRATRLCSASLLALPSTCRLNVDSSFTRLQHTRQHK
jgi:hypothetical protein